MMLHSHLLLEQVLTLLHLLASRGIHGAHKLLGSLGGHSVRAVNPTSDHFKSGLIFGKWSLLLLLSYLLKLLMRDLLLQLLLLKSV